MTYPDGRVVGYTRDALERIAAVQSTVNRVGSPILSALQYRADGTPASLTFGNGLTEARGYDPVGRLINQVIGGVDSRSNGFDAVGNLTSKQTGAESDQFTYDALSRLSSEQQTLGTSTSTDVFSYDPNGNRLTGTRNGATTNLSYTANSNRLIQIGTSALTLDAAGNTTSDTGGTRSFYYSPAGHLQWISQIGVPIAGYLYNGLGQRTGKLTLQGITLYHYDILGRLISETTVGSQPSRDYVWSGSEPVAQIDHWVPLGNMLQLAHCTVGLDGKIDWVTYLHTDELGSPRIGTDVGQNVVWRWDGEAFGETAPNQSVPTGAYPVYVNLRNLGQYFDWETGLFYNRARYYNPQTGRYISSDPIGLRGGLNTYAYVADSPLRWTDPLGLVPVAGYNPDTGGLTPEAQSAMDTWNDALQDLADDIKDANYSKAAFDQQMSNWAAANCNYSIGQGPFPGPPPVRTPPPPPPPQLAPVPIQPIN
jgi:RHS repeat-associated protein